MKRILALGLASIFALPIISTVTVIAYAEGSNSGSSSGSTSSNSGSGNGSNSGSSTPSSSDTTASPTTTSTTPKTETGDDAKSILDRVTQRKTELKTKLTALETTRIKTKCKASQGNLSSEKGRIKGIETSRSEVYTNLLNRLNDLSDKLKVKGIDTTSFNADIATLKTKIDTFNTDLTAYKQAVSDLAGMDCATDPAGFKASLDAARASLKKVTDDAAAVRSYLTDTIKPLLKTIRGTLEKMENTSDKTAPTPSTTGTGTTNTTTTSGGNQ